MGSTQEQIEAASRMDIWSHPDLLLRETPQFVAFLPDFYMTVEAVTNEQFAAFLSEMQPPPAQLIRWAPALGRITSPAIVNVLYTGMRCACDAPIMHR